MSYTASQYLNGLISGDRRVVNTIYDRYYPKVRTFVLQNKGKEDDVQDVFQDALMYLITKHKENPLVLQSFEAYLFTICKNVWRRTLKKSKSKVTNEETLTLEDKATDQSLFFMEQERLDFYLEKFRLLSQNCKEILSSYFNGMSYEEMVQELSYATVNTVRQRVFKCKAKMIQLMKSDTRYTNLRS